MKKVLLVLFYSFMFSMNVGCGGGGTENLSVKSYSQNKYINPDSITEKDIEVASQIDDILKNNPNLSLDEFYQVVREIDGINITKSTNQLMLEYGDLKVLYFYSFPDENKEQRALLKTRLYVTNNKQSCENSSKNVLVLMRNLEKKFDYNLFEKFEENGYCVEIHTGTEVDINKFSKVNKYNFVYFTAHSNRDATIQINSYGETIKNSKQLLKNIKEKNINIPEGHIITFESRSPKLNYVSYYESITPKFFEKMDFTEKKTLFLFFGCHSLQYNPSPFTKVVTQNGAYGVIGFKTFTNALWGDKLNKKIFNYLFTDNLSVEKTIQKTSKEISDTVSAIVNKIPIDAFVFGDSDIKSIHLQKNPNYGDMFFKLGTCEATNSCHTLCKDDEEFIHDEINGVNYCTKINPIPIIPDIKEKIPRHTLEIEKTNYTVKENEKFCINASIIYDTPFHNDYNYYDDNTFYTHLLTHLEQTAGKDILKNGYDYSSKNINKNFDGKDYSYGEEDTFCLTAPDITSNHPTEQLKFDLIVKSVTGDYEGEFETVTVNVENTDISSIGNKRPIVKSKNFSTNSVIKMRVTATDDHALTKLKYEVKDMDTLQIVKQEVFLIDGEQKEYKKTITIDKRDSEYKYNKTYKVFITAYDDKGKKSFAKTRVFYKKKDEIKNSDEDHQTNSDKHTVVIIDNLMWQDFNIPNSTISKKSKDEAVEYCKTLRLENYNDWRLPTIEELTSIGDINNYPALKKVFQSRRSSSFVVSSTTTNELFTDPNAKFHGGPTTWSAPAIHTITYGLHRLEYFNYELDTSYKFNVRCVRDIDGTTNQDMKQDETDSNDESLQALIDSIFGDQTTVKKLSVTNFWQSHSNGIYRASCKENEMIMDGQFTIKNTNNSKIYVEKIALAVHDTNGDYIFDMGIDNVYRWLNVGDSVTINKYSAWFTALGNFQMVAKAYYNSAWHNLSIKKFTIIENPYCNNNQNNNSNNDYDNNDYDNNDYFPSSHPTVTNNNDYQNNNNYDFDQDYDGDSDSDGYTPTNFYSPNN